MRRLLNGAIRLTPEGEIAHREWFRTFELRENIELFEDEFVVMPNHIHGIIWITGVLVGVEPHLSVGVERRSTPTRPFVVPGSLPAIVRAYKSAVTYAINSFNNTRGSPTWQRNYYEHIIGDEKEYENIVEYIYNNPANWDSDAEKIKSE